jgi:DNA-binding response OmpR family regulator
VTSVRVLVVHSDPADLVVLATVVAANDFELLVLEHTADLVSEALRFRPDAIVLDVKQRSGDGYELCKALKSHPTAQAIPLILTSSLASPEAHRLAFNAGCDDFIEKPINRHVLAYRLHAFARLRRAWERLSQEQA